MAFAIPRRLATACRSVPDGATWLPRLPDTPRDLEQRWSLLLGASFDEGSCAWVAPATLANGTSADDTWMRARGWALALGLAYLASSREDEAMGALGRTIVDAAYTISAE